MSGSAGAAPAGPGSGDGRGADLPPACTPEPTGGCSICGDEGREAEVLEAPADGRPGRVRMTDTGETARVALDLVAGVEAGDRVVVHMGFAIGKVRDRPTREGAP